MKNFWRRLSYWQKGFVVGNLFLMGSAVLFLGMLLGPRIFSYDGQCHYFGWLGDRTAQCSYSQFIAEEIRRSLIFLVLFFAPKKLFLWIIFVPTFMGVLVGQYQQRQFPFNKTGDLNLRVTYGFVFGVLGCLAAYCFIIFLWMLIVGVFWLLIFGDDSWPKWTNIITGEPGYWIAGFLWLALVMLSIVFGVQYGGQRLKEENQNEEQRKAGLYLVLVVLFLLGAIIFMTVKITSDKRIKFVQEQKIQTENKFVGEVYAVKNLQIHEKEDGLQIEINTEGTNWGKYEMSLEFQGDSYINGVFFTERDEVTINDDHKDFSYFIRFTDLATGYREILAEHVTTFDQPIGIMGDMQPVTLTVKLKLLEDAAGVLLRIQGLDIPAQTKSLEIKIDFLCDKFSCQVTKF